MGIIDRLEKRQPRIVVRNSYTGATRDRLTADWLTSNKTADEILKMQLRTLRERSRDLARNNDYVRKFLRLLKTNVVGPRGIRIQNRARRKDGTFDVEANGLIERGFRAWAKRGSASVCGRKSWLDIQRLVIENVAGAGEVLIYEARSDRYNRFGYALQVIEPDLLNEDYNYELPNGNRIRMGIEFDRDDRAVAYHLLTRHPGEDTYTWGGQRYRIVPASDIIHVYVEERPTQSRGVPWIHTAIIRLRMLGGYEEAELVAARIAASKMGFFIPPSEGGEYMGDDVDAEDNLVNEVSPGSYEKLPPGYEFKMFDPNHPSGTFEYFVKAVLRGASAGMGPGYNTLSSDLEGVNYSSLRQAALEERDYYRTIQEWFIEAFVERVYENWLRMALLTGAVPLRYADFDRLHAPKFGPRGWDWVDPLKEVKADIEAVNAGLSSRQRVLDKRGMDFEDIVDELAYEKQYAEERGVSLSPDPGAEPAPRTVNETGGSR